MGEKMIDDDDEEEDDSDSDIVIEKWKAEQMFRTVFIVWNYWRSIIGILPWWWWWCDEQNK